MDLIGSDEESESCYEGEEGFREVHVLEIGCKGVGVCKIVRKRFAIVLTFLDIPDRSAQRQCDIYTRLEVYRSHGTVAVSPITVPAKDCSGTDHIYWNIRGEI